MFKLVTRLKAAIDSRKSIGIVVLLAATALFGVSFLVKIIAPDFFFPVAVLVVAATWAVLIWGYIRIFSKRRN